MLLDRNRHGRAGTRVNPRVIRGHDRRSWGILATRFFRWRVDPHHWGHRRRLWHALDEPFWMRGVGSGQHELPLSADARGQAEVDRRRAFELPDAGIRGALPAPFLRREPRDPLPPLGHQMRRIEALLPQQRRPAARICTFARSLISISRWRVTRGHASQRGTRSDA